MRGLLRALVGLILFLAGLGVGGLVVWGWEQGHGAPLALGASADTAPARCWEATVYLPVADNNGHPFSDDDWRQALRVLVVEYGGATVGGPEEGWWLDNHQRLQREAVRPVVVSFERRRLDDFRRSVREVGRRLGQEAMYVRLEERCIEVLPVEGEKAANER